MAQPQQRPSGASIFRFAELAFDPSRGLELDGTWLPLGAQERYLLGALLEAGGKVVSKEALARAVWRHADVSDESISAAVFRLRKRLAEAGFRQVVATVYGGGFRIAVPVTRLDAMEARPPPAEEDVYRAAAVRQCIATAREVMGRRGLQDMASASLAARRALRLDRKCVEAWNVLAQISALRLNRGQYEARGIVLRRARWALRHALELAPDDGDALGLQGFVTAVYDADVAAGLALLDRAIARDDANWMLHMCRAWVLFAAKRRDEGLGAFDAMMHRNPLSTFSIGLYAYALGCAGRIQDAMAILDRSIGQMPTIDSLFFARSSVAAIAGDTSLAMRDARRCAALAPDIPNQLCALACTLAQQGDVAEARRLLERMTRMRCQLAPSWHALVLATLDERAEAESMMRRARSENCAWLGFVQFDPRMGAVGGA